MCLDGVDPRRLGPDQKAKYLTYLPATRDIAWPLVAGDLIALGGAYRELPQLELDSLMNRRVDGLSTGERSRVLIARALLPRPRLLLLDEPTANLDPLWQIRMMEIVRSETRDGHTAALIAIHDLDLAKRFADRIIVMNAGRVAGEGLDEAIVAQVFGIRKSDGEWQPSP
jgi:iron complex transport system ATP-binding protein